ncbi:MAG: hypothetical protein A2Z34_09455 [Planctomycetes bacterium RBG_16_59_8]|nr:MAG: hypothetical protein A2Z34_09455 [Planctomycetes bacterium RBG_16_59_8]
MHDGGFQDILGNALAVFWGGFLVGWLVFGKLGEALFAGMTKEEPPPEPTPAPTPPKQEKGTP